MSIVDTHCEKCGEFHPKSVFEDQIMKECSFCNKEGNFIFETDESYWAI